MTESPDYRRGYEDGFKKTDGRFSKRAFFSGFAAALLIVILIYLFGCSTQVQYVPEVKCSPYIISWQETLKDRWMYVDTYELREGCAGVIYNDESRVFCGTFQIRKNQKCK